MRAYEEWYDHLKSSFDTKGVPQLVFDSGQPLSVEDRKRLQTCFIFWSAYGIDKLWNLCNQSLDDSLSAFVWIWKLLVAGYPVDLLFKSVKRMVTNVRREEYCRENDDIIEDALWGLVEVLLPCREDTSVYAAIHGILMFPSKMYLENDSLVEEGKRDWFKHEQYLSNLPPVRSMPCFVELQLIIDHWLGSWTPDCLDHGYYTSGSTADCGNDLFMKIHSPAITPDLGRLLLQRPDLLAQGPALVVEDYVFYSKWLQVPKSATSLREIAMETAALNYWQKALDESLRKLFKRGPLARILNHERQFVNRLLAVRGSGTGEFATIDLSKASDSTRYGHIELFPWPLRSWLYAARSPVTLLDDELIFIEKYAAMGSPMTFDVMQVILAASGWLAEARVGIPETDRRLAIVGDDIVIETEAVPELYEILAELGYIVNYDKSYSVGNFRESCGAFAYKGVDITPPALPRQPLPKWGDRPTSAECSWLASFADRCWLDDALFTRYIAIQLILDMGNPWFREASIQDASRILEGSPLVEWEEHGYYSMISPAPTNWRLRRKSCRRSLPDYGKGMAQLLRPSYKFVKLYDDDQLYDIWLYINRNRSCDAPLSEVSLVGLGTGQISLSPKIGWGVIPG